MTLFGWVLIGLWSAATLLNVASRDNEPYMRVMYVIVPALLILGVCLWGTGSL